MIRVGIIGYGYWGPKLLRNFLGNPRFRVVALADRDREVRARLESHNPDLSVMEDGLELARRPDIDAVVVATPLMTHFPLAQAALEGGKHVLVEKPLAASTEQVEALIGIAERNRLTLMVDHTFLFTSAVACIRDVIARGDLGEVCYFDSMRANLGLFQPDVNCLWDLAPHDLSIINHVLAEQVCEVEASGYCHVNDDLPDMVYLTLHFAQKRIAHLNLSWMSPVKVRRFTVGGNRRMLVWDDLNPEQRIQIHDSGIEFQPEDSRATIIPAYRLGDIYAPRLSESEALAGVVGHFADVIEQRAESIMNGRHGLEVVRILEMAQKRLDESLARLVATRGGGS